MDPFSALVEQALKKGVASVTPLGGGSISTAMKATLKDGETVFIKISPQRRDTFLKEANGLRELARAGAIKTPAVLQADEKILVLEFLPSSSPSNRKSFFEEFGRQCAALHRCTSSSFGFFENNYIGSTPQENVPQVDSWKEFYFTRRLHYQFTLAEKNGYAELEMRNAFNVLGRRMDELIPEDGEPPSLLHGDLWRGNVLCIDKGRPAVIDPAVYYGHREADLAMTLLFGGFEESFYSAYDEAYPLNRGWRKRMELYKLYHLFNHLNIFGEGYYGQVLGIMRDLTR